MKTTVMLMAGLLFCAIWVHAETDDIEVESTEGQEAPKIYRSVDRHGNVIFSDQPAENSEDSEEVHLRTPNAVPMKKVVLPDAESEKDEPESAPVYSSLAITSPEPESTIRNPQEPVRVAVDLKPSMQSEDRLVLFDNGVAQADMAMNVSIRGTHTLVVKVLGPKGEVRITSAPVQVYVHRSTVRNFQNNPGSGSGNGVGTVGDPAERGNSANTGGTASSAAPADAGGAASTGSPASPALRRPVLIPR